MSALTTRQFLEKTNVPITAEDTIASLRAKLRAEFGLGPGEPSNFSNKFIQSLLNLRGQQIVAEIETGVRPVQVHYATGTQLRYFLPGMRGLFGYASVQGYMQSIIKKG